MTNKMGGFAGKILYVDLTHGEIKQKALDYAMAEKFVGGLGLTIKLAYDIIRPGVKALSDKNPIVLGAGPMVGTGLPSSSRVFVVTKLPLTGTIGWCGGGGVNFGYNFKNAGYDHIVIEGRAERPVYLKIIDDSVEICDAGFLWGKGVEETRDAVLESSGRSAGVISIGQAGENRVGFSMAYIDRIATLGRGGFGAVMGSKNLKAIVARGTKGVKVADRDRYKTLSEELLQSIREYPYLKEWQDLGMIKSLPAVPLEIYMKIKKRRVACVSCPIGCKDVVEIQDGEFKGLVACSSSVINLFSPFGYGFKDYRKAIKCIATLDEYGLDMFEFFGIMGLAKTLCDNGIIPKSRIDTEIDLSSLSSMEDWARKISCREGLGNILADGFNGIVEEFGEKTREYAPTVVKGMHPYVGPGSSSSYDLFGTMELSQVLEPRGPHVGSGGSPTYFARRPLEVFPRHFDRMGIPREAVKRILTGLDKPETEQKLKIGALLKYSYRWFSILGSLGICARAQINRFYNASLLVELYEAVTGIKTDLQSLGRRIDRVWTLYRMANVREGFDRKDEDLPARWVQQPGFKNYVTGEPQTRPEMEEMIEDYYEESGWDRKTGIPTAECLKKLDLTDL